MILFVFSIINDCIFRRQEEFAVLETIRHWRPKQLRSLRDLDVAVVRVTRWLGNLLGGQEH